MGNVWYIVILCVGILYLLNPFDLVPDFVPILGWIEDLVVVAVAFWLANRVRSTAPGGDASRQHTGSERTQTDREAMGERQTESLSKTPWQLLDIEPDADEEAVETAYKAKLMQYHPDRAAHLGEELQELAHEKTLELQRAYEHIKRQRA